MNNEPNASLPDPQVRETEKARCPVCAETVTLTARGKVTRHSRWHAKTGARKDGRYWHHCEGSGQIAKKETTR